MAPAVATLSPLHDSARMTNSTQTTAAERASLVLDRACRGTWLALPPAPTTAESSGLSTGEWDAYYSAPADVRRWVRRWLCSDQGFAPDQVAADVGADDVESWWAGLFTAVAEVRQSSSVEQWDTSAPAVGDLV